MKPVLILVPLAMSSLIFAAQAQNVPDAECGDIVMMNRDAPQYAMVDGKVVVTQMADAGQVYKRKDGTLITNCGGFPGPNGKGAQCPPAEWTCAAPNLQEIAAKRKADFLKQHPNSLAE